MKQFMRIIPIMLISFTSLMVVKVDPLHAQAQHDLFTEVLQDHVREGMVSYYALKNDERFERYIKQLANTDPETLQTREEKLAFWINVYNAYTLKIIVDNYPLDSISELHTGGLVFGTITKQTVWHKKLVTVNNQLTSLDHVEHQIIRPVFQEPRIHFAIVCAAISCPPLRSEAYEADKLDAQLDEQARIFLADQRQNSFDKNKRVARISNIFNWFKKDFAKNNAGLLVYLSQFLPEDVGASIRENPRRWKIRWSKYNWDLNRQ
jgi:hypothetical protein